MRCFCKYPSQVNYPWQVNKINKKLTIFASYSLSRSLFIRNEHAKALTIKYQQLNLKVLFFTVQCWQ
ncbi:hypothetical protein THOB06_40025 [Vibrio rotiferianus]|nr:hypothetical protein THOG10_40025 [Vibrio rotiferianus]CAH1587767.1 hypothetical protein THOB06_40025 [Vibrio rotiferianus]